MIGKVIRKYVIDLFKLELKIIIFEWINSRNNWKMTRKYPKAIDRRKRWLIHWNDMQLPHYSNQDERNWIGYYLYLEDVKSSRGPCCCSCCNCCLSCCSIRPVAWRTRASVEESCTSLVDITESLPTIRFDRTFDWSNSSLVDSFSCIECYGYFYYNDSHYSLTKLINKIN